MREASGALHAIAAHGQSAVITEQGATLRSYRVGDLELLDGFGADEVPSGARGQPLLPWPNRIRDGRYQWRGTAHQLPIDEVERMSAIHGLANWCAWRIVQKEGAAVTLGLPLLPRPGYPFNLELEAEYRLTPAGLSVTLRARNRGRETAPFGAGHHPYFSLGAEAIDELEVHCSAQSRLEVDERRLPTGRRYSVAGTEYGLEAGRPIGPRHLATTYTDLERGADGRARVVLRRQAADVEVAVWLDASFRYLILYTGDELAEPRQRRRGLAVEPLTCPADAFNSGEGLIELRTGDQFRGSWGIEPHL